MTPEERAEARRLRCKDAIPVLAKALDALDRLEAEVKRLTELCDRDVYVRQTDYMAAVKRAEKAEAELARLTEAVAKTSTDLAASISYGVKLEARWEQLNSKLRDERLASLDRPIEGYTDGLDNALYMMAALEREEAK